MIRVYEKQGLYFIAGDTYNLRGELKLEGCRWNANEKAWTTPKKEVAERYIKKASDEPTQRDKSRFVGKRTNCCNRFTGSKTQREPNFTVGDLVWMRSKEHSVVAEVVGFERATYYPAELLEDIGDYDSRPGYYGTIYYELVNDYKRAFEFAQSNPRPNALLPEMEHSL